MSSRPPDTSGRITREVAPIIPAHLDLLPGPAANPLPQALILTAIVISFSFFAFVLVLAYRAYPSIEQHLRRAYREGASMRELIEAMECAAQPGGGPTLSFALKYLALIEADIQAGKPV